jgi:hypothetical protein
MLSTVHALHSTQNPWCSPGDMNDRPSIPAHLFGLALTVAAAAEESQPRSRPGVVATRGDPLIDPLTGALARQLAAPSIRRTSDSSRSTSNSPFSNASSSAAQGRMEDFVADDLAAQEAAAREYQPQLQVTCFPTSKSIDELVTAAAAELRPVVLGWANILAATKGPLIGDKTPSHAITEAYAKADPAFVAKTVVSIVEDDMLFVKLPDSQRSTSLTRLCVQSLPQTFPQYRPVLGDGNCGWRGEEANI